MPRKILIVEDEPVSAKVLQRMLMDAGYQDVVIASEAREALKLLLMDQFDLLLVDWVLPGYSGPELIRRIRAGVKHRHTPIVMVTGQNELEHVREAIDAGINGYLIKPPEQQRLFDVLHKCGL